MTLGDIRKSLYCHPQTSDYQTAILCGDNSDIILKEKNSYNRLQKEAVSVSAMLVDTRQKNIAQAFILERYFFVSICPAAIPDTCLSVFLAAVLLLC